MWDIQNPIVNWPQNLLSKFRPTPCLSTHTQLAFIPLREKREKTAKQSRALTITHPLHVPWTMWWLINIWHLQVCVLNSGPIACDFWGEWASVHWCRGGKGQWKWKLWCFQEKRLPVSVHNPIHWNVWMKPIGIGEGARECRPLDGGIRTFTRTSCQINLSN